jgi:hypothetical protein
MHYLRFRLGASLREEMDEFPMPIDGRAICAHGQFRGDSPATNTVLGMAPECTSDESYKALAFALRAFPGWSAECEMRRAALLEVGDRAGKGRQRPNSIDHSQAEEAFHQRRLGGPVRLWLGKVLCCAA